MTELDTEDEACDVCGEQDESVRTVEFSNAGAPSEKVNECGSCRFSRQRGRYRDGGTA